MSAQATPPMRLAGASAVRRSGTAGWGWPVTLGFFLGGYAVFLDYENGASPEKAGLLGGVAAVVLTLVSFAVGRRQVAMPPELRATVHGTLLGIAMGLLFCLSGWSVLRSSLVGLIIALAMAVSTFYVVHTRRY